MYSIRTEVMSAEAHFIELKRLICEFKPTSLVLDPISALAKTGGHVAAVHASLRLLDYAKAEGITVFCNSLVSDSDGLSEGTMTQISTIADTWIHLAYVVIGGERNRSLTIVKSRGTKHSNQVRELILTDKGVTLADVYSAGGEVLMGTARWEKEAEVRNEEMRRRAKSEQVRRSLQLAEAEVSARIAALQRELDERRSELASLEQEDATHAQGIGDAHETMLRLRGGTRDRPTVPSAGDVARDVPKRSKG
jgi:circadian clock protein KaiC